MTRAALIIAVVLAAALAAALRAPALGDRPMHTDEAIHAVKCVELRATGRYVYDPHDYHGPTLYYAALPILWLARVQTLADTSEWMFRLVPVCFGIGLILLLPLVADGIGRGATAAAALLTAVSPSLVFYSRYYIQESLLVFFTFALFAAIWRYSRSGRIRYVIAAGTMLGLMHATKETWVIGFGCAAVALVITRWLASASRRKDGGSVRIESEGDAQASAVPSRAPLSAQPASPRRLVDGPSARSALAAALAGLGIAILVSTTLLSGFFTNLSGPLDAVIAFGGYVGRARGEQTAHLHPWYFYLQRYFYWRLGSGPVFSEAFIAALAVVGGVAAWRPRAGGALAFARFLSTYAIILAVVYSTISYKTPWSFLGVEQALVVLAGVGATAIVRSANMALRSRAVRGLATAASAVVLALGAADLIRQSAIASGRYAASPANPYVYGHPVSDVKHLAAFIERIGLLRYEHAPTSASEPVMAAVIADDAWPLPWYLRRMPRTGYWTPAQIDMALAAKPAFVIVLTELGDAASEPDGANTPVGEAALHAAIVRALGDDAQVSAFGVRPDCVAAVYVRPDLWSFFIQHGAEGPP